MSALRQSDSDALRALVREVLRELVPTARAQVAAGERPAAGPSAPRIEAVSVANDAELQAFVRRLVELSADPAAREALRRGRHSFRLANGCARCAGDGRAETSPAETGPARSTGAQRIDKGVLSESKVIALARAGRTIVVGKRVAVTPLARDKARQLGVKLERET